MSNHRCTVWDHWEMKAPLQQQVRNPQPQLLKTNTFRMSHLKEPSTSTNSVGVRALTLGPHEAQILGALQVLMNPTHNRLGARWRKRQTWNSDIPWDVVLIVDSQLLWNPKDPLQPHHPKVVIGFQLCAKHEFMCVTNTTVNGGGNTGWNIP